MIRVEFNGMDFPYPSLTWTWAVHHSPVFYDGVNVYENINVSHYEAEGFSGDGMRRTGGEFTTTECGEIIPTDDIPEPCMQVILQAWEQEIARQAQQEQCQAAQERQATLQKTSAENITIGGISHPRWQWRQGALIPGAPSAEDRAIIQAEGFTCEPQNNGFWYVIDPRAVEFME